MKNKRTSLALLIVFNLILPKYAFTQEIQKLAEGIAFLIEGVLTILFIILTIITTYILYRKSSKENNYRLKASIALFLLSILYFFLVKSSDDYWYYNILYSMMVLPLFYIILNNNKKNDLRYLCLLILVSLIAYLIPEDLYVFKILIIAIIIGGVSIYFLKVKNLSLKHSIILTNLFGTFPLIFILFNKTIVVNIGYALYETSNVFTNASISIIILYYILLNLISLLSLIFCDTFETD